MRVGLVGASGVLGRAAIKPLIEAGHSVRAIARRVCRDDLASRLTGAELFPADILDRKQMAEAVDGCDAVIHAATSIPAPGPKMDWSQNDRIRRDGTANLLYACAAAGVRRYVQQSVTMMYLGGGDNWLTTSAPLAPSVFLESAAEMEMLVKQSGLDWVIVRGGLLYGPDSGIENHWREQARDATLHVPGNGMAYVSLIHQEDLAAIICQACSAATHLVLNAVDDEPVRWTDLLTHIATQVGAPRPPVGAPLFFPSQRVSNVETKSQLKWQPKFPSYREGLQVPV